MGRRGGERGGEEAARLVTSESVLVCMISLLLQVGLAVAEEGEELSGGLCERRELEEKLGRGGKCTGIDAAIAQTEKTGVGRSTELAMAERGVNWTK